MNQHLENLKEIRSLMEKSSKFLSLSGLSGISAGIIAILAALWVYLKKVEITGNNSPTGIFEASVYEGGKDLHVFLIKIAIITFIVAVLVGSYFTVRKAKKSNEKVWNNLSKKLLISLGIPLISGAIFCFGMLYHHLLWMCPSATLVFYGLALINASKYTVRDVYYLGLVEIVLGLVCLFITGYALLFWTLGFGVLHIIYGASMYFKYEK